MTSNKHIWLPSAFFGAGLLFYIYYGVTWNAWLTNLPNLLIYLVIVVALSWALNKKEQLRKK
jgi:MFS superfamily sulfate permease-like transporter